MPEFNPKENLSKGGHGLFSGEKTSGVLTIENLTRKFEQLPDEGVLYCVDFGVADVTSHDFLKDPDRFPNMWGGGRVSREFSFFRNSYKEKTHRILF